MQPASPIFPNVQPRVHPPQVVYAKNQHPYIPLPVIKETSGIVTCRWHMTWRERIEALLHGDVYFQINTFNKPLQPTRAYVYPPVPSMWSREDYVEEE